jgi:YVTN family beta-propeller protein
MKYMISKQKLYSITLVSAAMVLMLVNIAGAAPFVYVANNGGNTVSVIDISTNTVVGNPITVGSNPTRIAITPNGAYAYVTNANGNSVSVIDTSTNIVTATITLPVSTPYGIAITPNGAHAYVTNALSDTVYQH